MSRKKENRLRSSNEILAHGDLAPIPCDRCLNSHHPCVVMDSRAKCAECVRQGKPCVNLSWQSLDATRQKLSAEIEQDEAELSRVLARLLRKKKILRQANDRAKHKTEMLLDEMEENGDLEDPVEDCPASNVGLSLSPLVWANMGMLEDAVLVGEPGGTAEASAGSSSNS